MRAPAAGAFHLLCLLLITSIALGQRPAPPAPQRPAAPQGPGAARTGAEGWRAEPKTEGGPAVLPEGDVPQVRGAPGDLPPRTEHLQRVLPELALDSTGRTRPEAVELVAVADGFALLFSDERDGARAFLLQRLDAGLQAIAPPERIDPEAGGKGQGEAALAVSSSAQLCSVWIDALDLGKKLRGRCWEPAGGAGDIWNLSLPLQARQLGAGEARAPALQLGPQPALAWTANGCALAWSAAGRILLREIDPRGPTPQRADILGSRTQLATSGPLLAADAAGGLACAFDAGGELNLFVRLAPGEGSSRSAGPGTLVGLAADESRAEGGWWVLARRQGQLVLRHLSREGGEDRPERRWLQRPWTEADLAVGPAGPCVLVQFADGGLEAFWLDAAGDEASLASCVLRPPASGVVGQLLVAASGGRFAFVWSERTSGEVALRAAACSRGGEGLIGPLDLLPGDGSAIQEHPAAAFAAGRGVLAWTDYRFGDPVVLLRGLDGNGLPEATELVLPATFEQDPSAAAGSARAIAKRPALALNDSGRGLAAWLGSTSTGPAILLQAFDVDAAGALRVRSAPVATEAEPTVLPTFFRPALCALAGDRGFVAVWVRSAARPTGRDAPSEDGRSELRIARVSANGTLASPARTIAAGPRLARPCVVQLDDLRIAIAWEEQPEAGARRLAARVLSERLELDSRVLVFATMWRGSDHSPAIAPAPGGFALAWTSGEDGERDVFARHYDIEGRPLSRPVALSTISGGQQLPSLVRCADGSFAAAWQDDLSRSTRLIGRRVRFPNATLGPPVRFPLGPEVSNPDFATPQLLAGPAGSLIVVGTHSVRAKGREIGLCQVGPDWDHVEGR